MLKRYGNVLSGALVLLLAGVLFAATFQIRTVLGMESLGAKFFPRVAAAGLAGLGAVVLVRGILEAARASAPAGDREAGGPKGLSPGAVCAIQTLILIAAYAALMGVLGFPIATALYLFAQMVVLSTKEQRRYVLFAIVSAVTAVAVYLIFTRLFYLMLPAGILG